MALEDVLVAIASIVVGGLVVGGAAVAAKNLFEVVKGKVTLSNLKEFLRKHGWTKAKVKKTTRSDVDRDATTSAVRDMFNGTKNRKTADELFAMNPTVILENEDGSTLAVTGDDIAEDIHEGDMIVI